MNHAHAYAVSTSQRCVSHFNNIYLLVDYPLDHPESLTFTPTIYCKYSIFNLNILYVPINFRIFNLRYEYFSNIALYLQLNFDLNNKYIRLSTYIIVHQPHEFPEMRFSFIFDNIANLKINKSMSRLKIGYSPNFYKIQLSYYRNLLCISSI